MTSLPLVIVVTGAGTGFGRLTAQTLAKVGHIVYGGLLHSHDIDPEPFEEAATFSEENNVQLHGIQLDITSDPIIKKAVNEILSAQGRIDVVVHNAGHMSFGPAEAFSAEQFMQLYDVNCVGCHRLNQAVLPSMRSRRSGLIVWVTSGSAHGPSSPFLAPYFAAKAAQDSLAQTLSLELHPFGIETSIIVPGLFTSGTAHFSSAMQPFLPTISSAYLAPNAPLHGLDKQCLEGSANMVHDSADPQAVADAVLSVVSKGRGERPWRVHVEFEGNGREGMAEGVNKVRDEVRGRYVEMMGLGQLLKVRL